MPRQSRAYSTILLLVVKASTQGSNLEQEAGCCLTVHTTPQTLSALRDLLSLTIPGVEDWLGGRLRWAQLIPGKPTIAVDAEVTPFLVDHTLECIGFRVAQGGSTLVHAADTRPCPNVVEYARGADLLIHEAYGSEDDTKQAHAFGHCTAAEAGKVARAAVVERLVLTHFPARCIGDPEELAAEGSSAFGRAVQAARDLDVFDF